MVGAVWVGGWCGGLVVCVWGEWCVCGVGGDTCTYMHAELREKNSTGITVNTCEA